MKIRTLVLMSALAACQTAPKSYEPAPLEGGESITYDIVTMARGRVTISFEKNATGFLITTSANAYPPQQVGPDLMAGRNRVEAYDAGMVWLPPSARKVGHTMYIGNVVRQETYNRRETWLVESRRPHAKRYYDARTGFLVAMIRQGTQSRGSTELYLQSSTIPGL